MPDAPRPPTIHIRPTAKTTRRLAEAGRVLAERNGGIAVPLNRIADRAIDLGLDVLLAEPTPPRAA